MVSVLFIQGGGKGAHYEDAALVDSLKSALGSGYDVRYPKMPDEGEPRADTWIREIASELPRMRGKVVLVGHSLGGALLLRYLAEEATGQSIAGLFLLAAPSWDEDRWNFDLLKLPGDITGKLSRIPRIFFYHCSDDDVVPFAHLALHSARIPQAAFRAVNSGGHQFGNDLSEVARDIRGDSRSKPG